MTILNIFSSGIWSVIGYLYCQPSKALIWEAFLLVAWFSVGPQIVLDVV